MSMSVQPFVVEIGLTAFYAPYVHENVEANFQKPGATAKFLERPLREEVDGAAMDIRRQVKV
jgi:hypothetical protein